MDIGFIGLGRMGLAMARNLARAGHTVYAWNRSPVASDAIAGGRIVATPAEAFQADVVFTMLSDDAAIRSVVLEGGLLGQARRNAVHVVAATISVGFAEDLAALHKEACVGYVSAPVFGRPDVAEAAELSIVAAGAPDCIAVVQPLFDVLGRRTFVMGESAKQANAAKIAGNMMIAMAIEAMAEAVVLAEANAVGRQAFIDLMVQTLFGCRVYQNYGGKIVAEDYEAGFRLVLGQKDLRLATAAASVAGKPTPMLDAVREQMARAADAGFGEKDWSALAAYTLRA